MNNDSNNIKEKRMDILKRLVVSEEHSIETIQEIVNSAEPHIKIEGSNGKVLLSSFKYSYGIREMIVLYLIGKFISHELGLSKKPTSEAREISENIRVERASMSGALNQLQNANIIKHQGSEYSIGFHSIKQQLQTINEKYCGIGEPQNKQPIRQKQRRKMNKQTTPQLALPVETRETGLGEDKQHMNIFLKKNNISEDELIHLYSPYKAGFVLLENFKGDSLANQMVKDSILALMIWYMKTGSWDMPSSRLRQVLDATGVTPLTTLSKVLKKIPEYVRHIKGPRGSTATKYRITPKGIEAGVKMARQIIDGEENSQVFIKSSGGSRVPKDYKKISIGEKELDENIKKFSSLNKIEEDDLRKRVEFSSNGPRLLEIPHFKTRRKLQRYALTVLATIVKRIYDIQGFNAKQMLKLSSLPTERLDLLLNSKEYKKCFNNTAAAPVEMTFYGEQKGIEYIKNLCHVKQ